MSGKQKKQVAKIIQHARSTNCFEKHSCDCGKEVATKGFCPLDLEAASQIDNLYHPEPKPCIHCIDGKQTIYKDGEFYDFIDCPYCIGKQTAESDNPQSPFHHEPNNEQPAEQPEQFHYVLGEGMRPLRNTLGRSRK